MTANLARVLTETAERSPESPAVRLDGTTRSYAELDEASARAATLLRSLGVGRGDRVGIMLPNVAYFPVVYYAVLRLGAVVVPMNVLLKGRETTFYLSDPGAKAVFAWGDFEDAARIGAEAAGAELILVRPGDFDQLLAQHEPDTEMADVAADDPAVILYTSGTTGTPKGAELSHASLYKNAQVTAETIATLSPDDVVLGALPLFHSFGQTCSMNASMYAGALLTMLPRFDPTKALETIARDKVTVFMGVPTMYGAMLHLANRKDYDVTCLRRCISGGASLPVELLRGFEAEFGCMILEGYGLSETSPVASFNLPHLERKPGTIGTAITGVEMQVASEEGTALPPGEVGEIWIRGHNVMKGYWKRADATAEVMTADGWFRTGDMGTVDDEGYYTIVDRKKDLIIRGGYNVYPREIEEVLYEHPAVREAAVIGIPDDSLGEEVAAAVVLKDGASATPEELRDHVKGQVAAYKYPRTVWLVDELPKGPTGKLLKREIKVPDEAGSGR